MASAIRALLVIGMVACLTSVAVAVPGTATFYTTYVPSACYGPQDQGVMIAAVNSGLYANGAACGRSYTVRCTGGPCTGNSVPVRVVDLCPGCGPDQIDLSQEAFAIIADTNAGRINIDYTQV